MSELKFVTLIDPDGVEVQVTEPAVINNLVYGQGYKVKGNGTAESAAESASGNAEAAKAALTEPTAKK